jgi:hypothetical protein
LKPASPNSKYHTHLFRILLHCKMENDCAFDQLSKIESNVSPNILSE